ncbi:MAG: hypothetical protein AAF802_02760 [Planctomycetota bacterium]
MIGSIASSFPADISSTLLQQLKATSESATVENSPARAIKDQAIARTDSQSEKLTDMGKEFESVFLSMLLKELRQSLDEGFFSGETSDSMGGMFDLFISKHLAESSPLGIGDMVASQVAKITMSDGGAAAGLSAIAPLNAKNAASYEKQRSSQGAEGPPSISVSA